MVIDFRAENGKTKLQSIFVEVIRREPWFH